MYRVLFYNRWKENFGKLQMHCSEFHEWLIHLNREYGALYWPYTLVPDPQNFLNFLKLWGLHRPWGPLNYGESGDGKYTSFSFSAKEMRDADNDRIGSASLSAPRKWAQWADSLISLWSDAELIFLRFLRLKRFKTRRERGQEGKAHRQIKKCYIIQY